MIPHGVDVFVGLEPIDLSVTMRQVHLAGEKVFIDYSGKKPHIWDRSRAPRP